MSRTYPSRHSGTQRIVLIVMGLVLLATVFLLPRWVSEPWLGDAADALPPVPEASPSAVPPSTAAELKRYRQESQSVLAEIVSIRDRLREQEVSYWAEGEFLLAMEQVAAGDERYSYGDYEASLGHFREAQARLLAIEESGRQKLGEAKAAAASAIEALEVSEAVTAIELAGRLAPQDAEVRQLEARTGTLPEVARHIESGDQALAQDRYEDARQAYRLALDLDPQHPRAAESLRHASGEITASEYRRHMSRGLAALEGDDYDGARSAFQAAGRIAPNDAAVLAALAQVENQQAAGWVSGELARAAALEAEEHWAEAQAVYEALLQSDATLTDAKVQLIPVRVRADLDHRLQVYIEEPLRLSSEAEYRAAQTLLADARGIAQPGPRLQAQIARLDEIAQRANRPVDVVFQSDNQTHVVLFRVADLGRFDRKSLKLRPGRYVAAGSRKGFRDVRVEFTVTGESLDRPIVVRCEEPVG